MWLWFEICKYIVGIGILSIQVNITLEWIPEDIVDIESTLVKVMAWCHEASTWVSVNQHL